MKRWLIALLALGFVFALHAPAKNPTVTIKTNKGTIKVELFEDKSPITVKNFLKYVDDKHYDNTIFHRVISKFMVQGGGYTKAYTDAKTKADVEKAEKKTGKGIKNEAKTNKLSNKRGTIAMARTNDPDSATAQFFINVVDNSAGLDPNDDNPAGYCVFGKVTAGMDVVDKIKAVKTKILPVEITIQGKTFRPFRDVPAESVVIESIRKDK